MKEHGIVSETYKLTGKIFCRCGKEFKEQEEFFKHLNQIDDTETLYKCNECGEELIGMNKVKGHYESKKHYCYNLKGTKMSVCFL